jgi:uncharacterized protein (TIGR03118 family)
MKRFRISAPAMLAVALCASPLAARANGSYDVTVLVSDGVVSAPNLDTHLVNPWGIAFNPNGFVWIANNGTGTSTLYDGNGKLSPAPPSGPLVVTIPEGKPTGVVFNGTQDFKVNGQAAPFVFSSEVGVISAWAPAVNPTQAQKMATREGAIYKGLALAANGKENFLYATDFHNGKIDVFDSGYEDAVAKGKLKCTFKVDMPRGFGPFGIQNINGDLFVTYAKQDADREDDVSGHGLGVVAVFDANGCLIRHFAGGWPLNAPWGMALAPASFGRFSNRLLIGNFGDGRINTFDLSTGIFTGTLRRQHGKAIEIEGLWGLRFGNGVLDQPTSTLFFTAGPDDEAHGIYGKIEPAERDDD